MKPDNDIARIELRLRELAQLFNSMDPSPFVDRDLDPAAEEFIVSWARELPGNHEYELVIQLATPPTAGRVPDVPDAVHRYFASRADLKERELRQLIRRGRSSLGIGLLFLAGCLVLSGLVGKLGAITTAAVIRESLTIGGWVAMWRPLEIFLYDLWPMRHELRLLRRLARMRVELVLPPS